MSDKKTKGEKSVAVTKGLVREQFAPFYNVTAAGVTVEFTDKFKDAEEAFKDAGVLPKAIWKSHGDGHSELVRLTTRKSAL